MLTAISDSSIYRANALDPQSQNDYTESTKSSATGQADKDPSAGQVDTVNISAASQAKLLEKQGQSVSQIASNLGLSTDTVKEYLGLTEDAATAIAKLAALSESQG
jgi:hypothetical protein